ncbi:TadE/TadG family type IV pilus assembly protein [Ruegeria arenilitoris]|uniref:TadE/TadG family type IV pilus assembly protein n=1 Tax=Ruegeria arenilitoris TaxID=1173585 RepID=UPI00147FD286|nr:TadE/TadG family type IV pilus assembly protein [Ruegeria arenilitoris]
MIVRVFKSGSKKLKNFTPSARRFARDEEGGVFTIFVLTGFLIIICLTGMGADIMHFERDRANLQATLDRAVLAAADLDQELPPKDVVMAYVEKSDIRGKLTKDPVVTPGFGSRRVTAEAEVVVKTAFMYLAGIPELKASVTSTAEESVGAIEISLVLDMSGSMENASAEAGKKKIQVLREAAKEFVTTMYEKENPEKISISIIPYATQVNAGENILGKMTGVTDEHNYSHCVNFTSSQFQEHNLTPSTVLERTAHFDRYRSNNDAYQWEHNRRPTCPTRAGSVITPVTNDIAELHAQIGALTASGNTSIDIGMKWAAALVDPEFRPIITQLASQKKDPDSEAENAPTVVPTEFANRPKEYTSDVQKVIIVMTDGYNTSQYKLKNSLRSGNSPVWYNPNYSQEETRYNWDTEVWETVTVQGEYSIRSSTNPNRYYWSRQERWNMDHRYGDRDDEDGTAARLTYPELFALTSLRWNARYNFYPWDSSALSDWYSNAYYSVSRSSKNTRTSNICSAIKNKGVLVYGIAFEAPDAGLTTIENCATKPSMVYEVNSTGKLGDENLTLEEAFRSIASSIKRLRLTQ